MQDPTLTWPSTSTEFCIRPTVDRVEITAPTMAQLDFCEEFIQAVDKQSRKNAERFERRRAGKRFDRAEFLVDAIDRSGGEIRLVLATSWRNSISVDALTGLLPPRLRNLVAGVIDRHFGEHRDAGIRGRLMERWIAEHAQGALCSPRTTFPSCGRSTRIDDSTRKTQGLTATTPVKWCRF